MIKRYTPAPKPPASLTLRSPARFTLPPTFISEVSDGAPSATSRLAPALMFRPAADKVVPLPSARCPPLLIFAVPNSEPLPVRVPPLFTLTNALPREPSTSRVPALIAVLPVMPLIPLSVSVPVPTLIKLPAPLRSPSKVLLVFTPPTVRFKPPPTATPPAPLRPARLESTPRFSAAPVLTLTPEVLPNAPVLPVVTLPETIFNGPVNVLLPLKVRSAKPFLISALAPLSTPLRFRSLLPASVRSPFKAIPLPRVKVALVSRVAAPPTVKGPAPNAPAVPKVNVPALRLVPPVNVLVPSRVRLARPSLISAPAPLTTPPRVSPLAPPTVSPALRAMPLPSATAEVLLRVAAPPTVKLPRPSAVLLPTVRLPEFRVVPPRKLLLPLSVRPAVPSLVRLPAPLTVPPRVRLALPPIPRLPARLIALVSVALVLASRVVPAAAFNVPAPKAPVAPITSLPLLSAVLPR